MELTLFRGKAIENNQRIDYFYSFLIAFFVFWSISGYGSIANYLSALSAIVLLLYIFLTKRGLHFYNKESKTATLFLILFFAYHSLTSLANVNDWYYWLGNVIFYVFISYFPFLIVNDLISVRNRRTQLFVLQLSLFIWAAIAIFSIVTYLKNPELARDAIVYQNEYDNLFIGGGYYLAYGSCILCVFIFGLIKKGFFRKKSVRIGLLLLVLLLALHVYLTKSTLTTVWLFVGLLFELIFYRKRETAHGKATQLAFVVSLVVLIAAFYLFKGYLGNFLTSNFDYSSDALYSRRLYELGTMLTGDSITRHTYERLSKPLMSWSQFLTSPVFGIGYKYGYVFSEMKISGLGTHSEIVDTLAKYGLIGFTLWAFFIFFYIKSIKKTLDVSALNMWWIILAALMFFNPFISLPSTSALLLIVPLISVFAKEKRNE